MIIMTSCSAQLGNQLVLFAHFIAFAIENDLKVVNLNFYKYAHLFENTNKDFFTRYPAEETFYPYKNQWLGSVLQRLSSRLAKIIDRYQDKLGLSFVEVIKDYTLLKGQVFELNDEFKHSLESKYVVISLGCLFRTHSLLEKYSNEIRDFFTPIKQHSDNVSYLMEKLKKKADILVGVHIRQRDYNSFLLGQYFYTTSQYADMMDQVQSLFPDKNIKFLICSDIQQEVDRFEGLNFTFGTNHLLEDMYSLASCDYIMGSQAHTQDGLPSMAKFLYMPLKILIVKLLSKVFRFIPHLQFN